MPQTVYVCTGSCKAEISQERYDQELTKCGAESCTKKGVPFEKRLKCDICGKIYKEEENHTH